MRNEKQRWRNLPLFIVKKQNCLSFKKTTSSSGIEIGIIKQRGLEKFIQPNAKPLTQFMQNTKADRWICLVNNIVYSRFCYTASCIKLVLRHIAFK